MSENTIIQTQAPARSNANKLYTITSNDFILKGIELNKFKQIEVSKLDIDYKNIGLFQLIFNLLEIRFLTNDDITGIIKQMSAGRLPILEYIEERRYKVFQNKKERIAIGKNIPDSGKQIYKESVNNIFQFNEKNNNIVIYDIDHTNEQIITFIAAPAKETYEAISKFKKESEELKLVKKFFYINKITGKEELKECNLVNYRFTIIVAPLNIINTLHSYNIDLEKGLTKSIQSLDKKLDKIGVQSKVEDSIFKVDKSLNETEGTIENILTQILLQQNELGASDIHIEPLLDSLDLAQSNAGFIRFRVDGDLTDREKTTDGRYIPAISNRYDQLIYQLKDKCGMKTSLKTLPQDRKLQINIHNELLEYRVSTMPIGDSAKGKEKMVLRKLSRDTSFLNLKGLNMDADKKKLLDDFIGNPEEGKAGKFNNGLILMTGPTGSGKSTTLFSILNQINVETVNIQTLEDPIEYVLPGLNQSQISDSSTNDTGSDSYTYAKGIKACLRQDPDIILIGEIRDEITMESGKDAAATGHLVFSSLHTNDTWQTLDRLEGIGFDLHLVGNIVRLIMAQRLGKLICPNCIKEYNDPVFSEGDKQTQIKREEEYLQLKMEVVRKLIDSPYITDLPDDINDIKLYDGEGNNCSVCKGKKIKGRTGIYEFLPITIGVEAFILKHGAKVSNEDVKQLFMHEEVTTLYQNALWKTFHPIITEKGPRYMSYTNAISGAGADVYDWGKEYMDTGYHELNLILKKKKTERKIKIIENEMRVIEMKIAGEQKMINAINKTEKEQKIAILLKEQEVLVNEKSTLEEYIKGLGLDLVN